jgi:four helix bundle protein
VESNSLKKMQNSPHHLENLLVWRKAVDLSVLGFKTTKSFPKEEMYGLSSQTTRASVSIAANIAEGAGRNTPGEFRQFLGIARGSCYELKTLSMIAKEVGYLDTEHYSDIGVRIDEILKMMHGLLNSLEKEKK